MEGWSVCQLINEAVRRGEGRLTEEGALSIETGKYTGRSPKDRFIVLDRTTRGKVAFGKTNLPLSEAVYHRMLEKVAAHLSKQRPFLVKARAGASQKYGLTLNIVTESAAQAAFSSQIFLKDAARATADADFTVVAVPSLKAEGKKDGLHSEAFVIISFKDRMILIGGTHYSGEIKKAVFSVMNHLLPERGVLPMHCSANRGADGTTALFFGLSGTGKTTLSTDPRRSLIGDDEHGWSAEGIFNFEGGCYAKCIHLHPEREKEIHQAIRFGAVLENVVLDAKGRPDYADGSLTENTRVVYPLEHIDNIVVEKCGGHPQTILFLTADAFGVLPPIARLTKEGAMYHFMSGYTSKLAGTERGVVHPETTFSALFGEPFMPRSIETYAGMLGRKMEEHGTEVYLVNTGWTGGAYGVGGKRIPLVYTRAMVNAALSGALRSAAYRKDPIFNLLVPKAIPGIPEELLDPALAWKDAGKYQETALALQAKFAENFTRFPEADLAIRLAGPGRGEERLTKAVKGAS